MEVVEKNVEKDGIRSENCRKRWNVLKNAERDGTHSKKCRKRWNTLRKMWLKLK